MRLSIQVMTKFEHIFQISACHNLLCPSPCFDDSVRALLVRSKLLKNPRREHVRVTGKLPCGNGCCASPARKLFASLHTFLIPTDANRNERNSEHPRPLLPRWNGAG